MGYLQSNNINIVSLMLAAAFFYPIIIGMLFKLKSRNMMETIKSVLRSIAFLLAIMITIIIGKELLVNGKIYSMFPDVERNSKVFIGLVYLVVFVIINGIFKLLIEIFNSTVLRPISKRVDFKLRESGRGVRSIFGGIFQIPKSLCYVLVLCIMLTCVQIFIPNSGLNSELQASKVYTFVNSNIIIPTIKSDMARNLPHILEDSFRIEEDGSFPIYDTDDVYVRGIVFYNGVTLEEGIKSNEEIDNFAREIAHSYDNTYDKAKAIYKWVGTNIKYDNEKAIEVMNTDMPTGISSGAISTFDSRSGVCFDYACLYSAMCRANGIGTRLIIGEGFNGTTWVSHSWNEAYIPEEERWIKVDPTFYGAGNYFDNARFDLEHRNRKIAGEWLQ